MTARLSGPSGGVDWVLAADLHYGNVRTSSIAPYKPLPSLDLSIRQSATGPGVAAGFCMVPSSLRERATRQSGGRLRRGRPSAESATQTALRRYFPSQGKP